MKYNFKVKPEAFKEFVDDVDDIRIKELKEDYKEFRVIYDSEPDPHNPLLRFVEALDGDSECQQILMQGLKDDNEYESIAYCFVGSDYGHNDDWHAEGMKLLDKLIKEYKVD